MDYQQIKDIFSKNIEFFFSDSSLKESLLKEKIYNEFYGYFEIAKDGNPNFKINGRYLYSKYQPCEKFKKLDIQTKDKILILESGFGLSFFYYSNNKKDLKNEDIFLIYTSFYSFLSSLFIIDYSSQNLKKVFIYKLDEDEKYLFLLRYLKDELINNRIIISVNLNLLKDLIYLFLSNNIKDLQDFNKFKFHFESLSINSEKEIKKSRQIVEIINSVVQSYSKSLITEKYFSKQWERNIKKNLKIYKEKNWLNNNKKEGFYLSGKKGIIFWGASFSTEIFLTRLNLKQISTINSYFISISITSSVNLLKQYKINIDYQTIFDAGIFGFYNIEDFNIPLICSAIIHPSITKNLKVEPILINLLTEEEKNFIDLDKLIKFPFYGATLPTLYKGFKELTKDREIKLFLVGSDFKSDERQTHHGSYSLYKYLISKQTYFNTSLNWETDQKIMNTKKFPVYQESIKRLNILNELKLEEEIKNLNP